MHQARRQLGQHLTLYLLTTGSTGMPVAPDAVPTLDIYSVSGKPVSGQRVPAVVPSGPTGLFQAKVFLSSSLSTGSHTAVFRWTKSGTNLSRAVSFLIIPGGDASGSVVSMFHTSRPQADFTLHQRDGGSLYRGKNPSV